MKRPPQWILASPPTELCLAQFFSPDSYMALGGSVLGLMVLTIWEIFEAAFNWWLLSSPGA